MFDVGSHFMQRFNALYSFRTAASSGNDPQGGGAEPGATQRFRTWFEGYGSRQVTDAQGAFPGDNRKTAGGVAGFGTTIAPGATVGLSVDQSQTRIGVNGGTQSGRLDFTQIGGIGAYEHGPWNISVTAVYGHGDFHTNRFDAAGASIASYQVNMWAAMSELSLLAHNENVPFVQSENVPFSSLIRRGIDGQGITDDERVGARTGGRRA
ncbi:MAG: autotransporter outer membrane beta-barrel domain-containing protein, partial [Alphaproteobacteria bacterium]|nr:autotransporter outer membrane beta-barrel domain-containing protein [Alphaproteobacteria bacterium]